MRRNILIAVVVLIACGAGGSYYWQQQQAQAAAARAAAIRTGPVGRGTLIAAVSATGYLAPQQQVNLYFASAGLWPVVALNVELGQTVKAGEVLARLESRDLELAVTQAEQNLAMAQLALAILQAPPRPEDVALAQANARVASNQVYAASLGNPTTTVEIARLQLIAAQGALEQTHRSMDSLVEQGKWNEKVALESQEKQQIDNARIAALRYDQVQEKPAFGRAAAALAAMEQAQAQLEKLQNGPSPEDVDIAKLQISQAEAALEIAYNNLKNARIVAPFAGVIAAVNLRVGEPAASALPAVVLVDISQFYLEVLVDEVDVARLVPGQRVSVTLDALPNALLAAQVEKIAQTSTLNAGVVSYQVRVVLDKNAEPLRGGMTATAEIVVKEAREVVLVPNWAIRRDQDTGATFVGILQNGAVVDVPVKLGLRDDTHSEVISGLKEGETVAVDTTREQFNLFGAGN